MVTRNMRGAATDRPKEASIRDIAILALAAIGVILANIGVVRALDVALDAFYR